jgi:hypothetical protein
MLLSFCSSSPLLFPTNSRIWSHALYKQQHVYGRSGLLGTRYGLPFLVFPHTLL